jgi:hypothetical protein
MIVFTPKTIEWTSEDALRLKEFLNSMTGHRLLQVLDLNAPEILDGSHKNKALVTSGRVAQHQETLNMIFRLTYEDPNAPVVPEVTSPNYPSLEEDAAWEEKPVDKPQEPRTS